MSGSTVPGLPWIGNLHQYRLDKIGFLSGLRDRYGDFVRFRLGRHVLILVTHPEDIHRIEMRNSKNYVKATNLRELVGDGILMSEGEKWRKQRRLIAPVFHPGSLSKMVDDMNRRIGAYVGDLKRIDSSPVEISESMKRLVFGIVSEALFGAELGDDFDGLRESMGVVNRLLTRRFGSLLALPRSIPTPSNRRFQRAIDRIDSTIGRLVSMKSVAIGAGERADDLVSRMILARDSETGEGMDAEQLRDETVSMLLAGFETTGHLLPWILHELALRPDLQRRLHAEVDERIGDAIPDAEAVMGMPFLGAVVDEALRMYPPVWAWTKRALEDDDLRGNRLRAGSILYVSPYLIHRHPRWWDRPDAFDPDRWTPELREKNRLAFFPFGMGPRTCVGRHFALLEVKLILIRLIQTWTWNLSADAGYRPDFQITLGMTPALRLDLRRHRE